MQAKRWGRAELKQKQAVLLLAAALAVLFACAVLPAHAQAKQKLCFPLASSAWRISDTYGWRQDPFTGQQAFHKGIDLACAEGTTVLAAQDGMVVWAKQSASYGNCLRLLHADGSETRYAHLQYLYVRAGEVVNAGQALGTAGQSGRATGAHLHFELWRQGEACDPAAALELPDA